jgi:hypothetical protein
MGPDAPDAPDRPLSRCAAMSGRPLGGSYLPSAASARLAAPMSRPDTRVIAASSGVMKLSAASSRARPTTTREAIKGAARPQRTPAHTQAEPTTATTIGGTPKNSAPEVTPSRWTNQSATRSTMRPTPSAAMAKRREDLRSPSTTAFRVKDTAKNVSARTASGRPANEKPGITSRLLGAERRAATPAV